MYIVFYSSLLPVGEIMPNKCNPRIKLINPDSIQEGLTSSIFAEYIISG